MPAPTFSYSKLSAVGQCELQYCMRYCDKMYRREASIEQHVGIVVHKVIEMDLKGEIPSGPTAHWEVCNDLFDQSYSPKRIYDPRERGLEHWRGHAMKCVSNYLRMGKVPAGWELVGTEIRKGMPLIDSPMGSFMGIIDMQLGRGAAHDVTDFKTGKIKSKKDFEADHQLPLYAALVAHESGTDKPIRVRRVNLGAGKIQEFLVDKDRRHEALMWAAERAHLCIQVEADYAATREAEPTKSILCDWCAFKKVNLCPAWADPGIV